MHELQPVQQFTVVNNEREEITITTVTEKNDNIHPFHMEIKIFFVCFFKCIGKKKEKETSVDFKFS